MARARDTLAPLPALALSTIASSLPLLGFAWLLGERIVPLDWGPLIGLAVVSQIVGQGLMIYALGRALAAGRRGGAADPAGGRGGQSAGSSMANGSGVADLAGVALVAAALVLVRRGPVAPRAANAQEAPL